MTRLRASATPSQTQPTRDRRSAARRVSEKVRGARTISRRSDGAATSSRSAGADFGLGTAGTSSGTSRPTAPSSTTPTKSDDLQRRACGYVARGGGAREGRSARADPRRPDDRPPASAITPFWPTMSRAWRAPWSAAARSWWRTRCRSAPRGRRGGGRRDSSARATATAAMAAAPPTSPKCTAPGASPGCEPITDHDDRRTATPAARAARCATEPLSRAIDQGRAVLSALGPARRGFER